MTSCSNAITDNNNMHMKWRLSIRISILIHPHTHTNPFNGSFSGTTRVSRNQKGKTNLDFTEAVGHMQVCT